MGPIRKSRSVNKRFSYDTEISPTKEGNNTNKKSQRKKKLSDMLGPHWSKEELEIFYGAYRKHGRDWRKVSAVLQNRSVEMVEAVYSLNKAYLSLPEGTASVAGFIAMMTDYYSNKEERDSEQERNDDIGTYQKPKKRMQRKVHETTFKGLDERFPSPQAALLDYSFLSSLKKKRSGGSQPRAVGKRTPRFPVSHSYDVKGEKYFLPTRKGQKPRADNDDDVAHSIAMALAEASNRGCSPQISQTPSRRSDSLMSSPCQSAERMCDESDVASGWLVDNHMYDDDIEGSMEADNTDFSRGKSKGRENAGYILQGKKVQFDRKEHKHLDYTREAYSGTEGQNLGTLGRNFDIEVADAKCSSSQGSKKRSKEVPTGRVEIAAFDALETLANLSLMISPEANENDSVMQTKEGKDKLLTDSNVLLSSRQKEKCKSSVFTAKRNQSISRLEAADDKGQTSAKDLVDGTDAASEAKESHQLINKVSRKRQKILAPKATDATQMFMRKSIFQSSSHKLVKNAEHVSSVHTREVHNSPLSNVPVSEMNPSKACTKVSRKRKMNKPETLEVAKFSDVVETDKCSVPTASLSHRTVKGKVYNFLSNQLMRRWCRFEWLYSAIDDPWFAKREFVEYLYHVGLGHVPRLSRLEWGVIRSSLGKPRRFSHQFLKEEKDKLNQYRDSVRTHYSELRAGSREGLPTDLARPLSLGQRVIAIHPKTRDIHDGTVLTVDHNWCRVQFDWPELGVERIMDADCMPLNPFENMPASMMRRTHFDKFYASLNEVNINVLGKDQRLEGYTKCYSCEKLKNMDEVASVQSDLQSRNGPRDITSEYSIPGTLAQIQAKEADVEAIAELTLALDKKEAVIVELKRMNDDVLDNQTDGDFALQDSEAFKKQYAAILVQLNETNAQVSSALHHLRQRNTYQSNSHLTWPKTGGDLNDHGVLSNSSDHIANHTEDIECHVNEIVELSRSKARTMVDIAIQAMSTLKINPTVDLDNAVDYVNDRLPSDDSYIPSARHIASDPVCSSSSLNEKKVSTVRPPDSKPMKASDINKGSVPSELISRCVATMFVIQKCTERQFPPAEVASLLDSVVSSLQPCSPQNLQVYGEIQNYMGILKNQILALVPT